MQNTIRTDFGVPLLQGLRYKNRGSQSFEISGRMKLEVPYGVFSMSLTCSWFERKDADDVSRSLLMRQTLSRCGQCEIWQPSSDFMIRS